MTNDPTATETRPRGAILEFLCDGRIVIYRMTSQDRKTVDTHFNDIVQTMCEWPSDRPYLALYDYASEHFVGTTPYVREKKNAVARIAPDLAGYQAVLVSNRTMAVFGNLMIRLAARSNRVGKLFTSEEAAIEWLMSKLDAQT